MFREKLDEIDWKNNNQNLLDDNPCCKEKKAEVKAEKLVDKFKEIIENI